MNYRCEKDWGKDNGGEKSKGRNIYVASNTDDVIEAGRSMIDKINNPNHKGISVTQAVDSEDYYMMERLNV